MSILDKNLCLVLNAGWQAIGHLSVRKSLVALCSEADGQKAAMGMDMETVLDENGDPQLVYSRPVEWAEWITLPIRDCDLYIQTAHQRVRVPLVIVCSHVGVPLKKPRLGKNAILERDGYTCQYTGRKLPRAQLNIDHVVPRDRGGRDEWGNLVACDKDLNSRKGNRLNSEAGLKLIRTPKAPVVSPVIVRRENARDPSWLPFLAV